MPRHAREIGKEAERRAARALGGKRTTLAGVSAADVIDAHGEEVEVKYRTRIPDWLHEIFFTTKPGKTVPKYAVLYIKGEKDGLVIQRLSQFKEIGLGLTLPSPERITWEEQ